MGIKTLFLIAAAAVGGIYLTSDEGKEARKVLQKRKSTFKPIIDDLLKQANEVLQGTKELNSPEMRKSIEALVNEAKDVLLSFDLEKTVDGIRESIIVASKKIREGNDKLDSTKEKASPKPTQTKQNRQSKTMELKLSEVANKNKREVTNE